MAMFRLPPGAATGRPSAATSPPAVTTGGGAAQRVAGRVNCRPSPSALAAMAASSGPDRIRALFEAGADVFRLNFSHGSHADHKKRYDIIRYIEQATKRPIAVLVDLQGPKLRVGQFKEGSVTLTAGQKFRFDLDPTLGDQNRAPLPHPEILSALKPGVTLLLDDGKLRMRVKKASKDAAECEVEIGGKLSDRKGVNVPDVVLPLSPLTKKDHADLIFALDLGADWIALSFVQRPEDVAEARKLIQGRARIISKLEKPAAIERLDEIVELSDAVMVARGDLGVEMPAEDVPSLQKRIIAACRLAGKPVVVATQMLDSMVNAPTPTRAEASDVATAVYDGADAVMLSAETASGQFPLESVAMMNRIAERVERDPFYRRIHEAQRLDHAVDGIEPGAAIGIGADARQNDMAGRGPGRPHAVGSSHRHLYDLRLHGPAHGARAAGSADHVSHLEAADGAQHGAGLGHALRRDGRPQAFFGNGRQGLPPRLARRLRQGRRTHRGDGRCTARHARLHEHSTRRLGRGVRRRRASDPSPA